MSPAEQRRVADARACVQSRPADDIDRAAELLAPFPPELAPYLAQLRTQPALAGYFAGEWRPWLVDLRRVRVFQPFVSTDGAVERVSAATQGDMLGLARLCLPTATGGDFPISYDEKARTFSISSANPNLRVLREPMVIGVGDSRLASGGSNEGRPPLQGVGFIVGIQNSVMTVIHYQDRFFLRDGYHRAVSLLARGIYQVPVFVRSAKRFEDLNVQDMMLGIDAFLGPRPPRMPDFLDDRVSAEVRVPVTRKVIVIQAAEVMING